ncbi:hypothetical protein MNBD_ALPHA04-1719 [hydrothermal vent metagenome]|uniref:Two-component transcriptional response regulator, LuxR family n=1 Tax=hydrothermal vent metagenome TaxID=652676 RepID=A0A3B0R7D9_9ZZZZ
MDIIHSQNPLRIVLGDDHAIVRAGLRGVLERDGRFTVLADAQDGLKTIAATKQHRPDILIVDIAMPVITGLEVVEEICRWCPDTKIVLMTGLQNPTIMKCAMASGAHGLLLKGDEIDRWPQLLCDIANGEMRVSRSVKAVLDEPSIHDSLTRRERQIFIGLIQGSSNGTLAARLGISINTVNNHRTSLMQKLDVHSLAELMTLAARDGLLEIVDHTRTRDNGSTVDDLE